MLLDNGDIICRIVCCPDECLQQFLWDRQGFCEEWWLDADIHYFNGIIKFWLLLRDSVRPFTVAQTSVVYCLFVLELHGLLTDL